jgi:hypothetical protein
MALKDPIKRKEYTRLYMKGYVRRSPRSPCTIEGCANPHLAKGVCHNHYEQLRRTRRRDISARSARFCRSKAPEYAREKVRAQRAKKRKAIEAINRRCPSVCECCGGVATGKRNIHGIAQLHLDHDHETGDFRGWLCTKCNTGIGLLGDSVKGLERAVNYLVKAALL